MFVWGDVCELLKPVLELNLSTDGVFTLCADSKVKSVFFSSEVDFQDIS